MDGNPEALETLENFAEKYPHQVAAIKAEVAYFNLEYEKALDLDMTVLPWLEEWYYSNVFTPKQIAKYRKAIQDKRRLHAKNKTTLLETWSVYKDRRPLIEHLKEILEKEGIHIRVVDIHTIKPIDKEMIIKSAKETKKLISIEDHSVIGGLGSAISKVLTEEYPCKLTRMGIKDTFGKSGNAIELLKYFGLTSDAIIKEIKE